MRIGAEFELDFPCYVLSNLTDGMETQPHFAACNGSDGMLALMLFTDLDLINRHIEAGESPDFRSRVVLHNAVALLNILRRLSLSTTQVVFDPNYQTRHGLAFSRRTVEQSLERGLMEKG